MKKLLISIFAFLSISTASVSAAELVTTYYSNEFPVGTEIDFDNMYISDEGKIVYVTEDMVGAYDKDKVGRQIIQVRYKDQLFEFAVNFVTDPPDGMNVDGTITSRGGPYNLIITSNDNTVANDIIKFEYADSNNPLIVPAYTGADGREYAASIFTREDYGFRVFGNYNLDYYPKTVSCPLVDISNAWYTDNILDVYSRNLMIGLTKYEFRPNKSLTRAELAYILYRYNNNPEVQTVFYYEGSNAWCADAVSWLYGDILGFDVNMVDVTQKVTREEVAHIIYQMYGFERTSPTFNTSDFYDTYTSYYQSEIHTLKDLGLMTGDTENNFHPKSNLSRAEMATILLNCIQYKVDSLDQ